MADSHELAKLVLITEVKNFLLSAPGAEPWGSGNVCQVDVAVDFDATYILAKKQFFGRGGKLQKLRTVTTTVTFAWRYIRQQ
jgi:hypothetical protein